MAVVRVMDGQSAPIHDNVFPTRTWRIKWYFIQHFMIINRIPLMPLAVHTGGLGGEGANNFVRWDGSGKAILTIFVCCQAARRQPLSSTDNKIYLHHSSQCFGRRSKRVPPKRKSETLLFKPTWTDWTLHYICYARAGVHKTKEGSQSGRVIHLAPTILRWIPDLWKISVLLRCDQVHTWTQKGGKSQGVDGKKKVK